MTNIYAEVGGGNESSVRTDLGLGTADSPSFSTVNLTNTSNQLVLGTTRTLTISTPTPASSSRVATINDFGADFVFAQATAGNNCFFTTTGPTTVTLPTTGTLVNTAVTSLSSLATVGTITSGTWNGTTIDATHGGTAQSSWTTGDFLYASATNTLSKLAGNTTTTVKALLQTGTGSASQAPAWTAIPVSITGTANQVIASASTGAITLTTPQDIAISSSVSFATGTLSNTTNQLVLGAGVLTTTITSPAPAAARIYTISDFGANGVFALGTAGNNCFFTTTAATNVTLPTAGTLVNTASSTIAFTGGTIDGATLGATTPMQIQGFRPVNTQTGTTYTLVLGDNGKMVTLNNASAITATIPPNSSVAFPLQTEVDFAQLGAGQVTFAAGAGVTIRSYTSLVKLAGQYAGATAKQTATTDTWLLIGNLA